MINLPVNASFDYELYNCPNCGNADFVLDQLCGDFHPGHNNDMNMQASIRCNRCGLHTVWFNTIEECIYAWNNGHILSDANDPIDWRNELPIYDGT